MEKAGKYYVAVYVGGKYSHSFFADDLDMLVTLKALLKDCDIEVMETRDCRLLSQQEVSAEIRKAGDKVRQQLRGERKEKAIVTTAAPTPEPEAQKKTGRPKKYWERKVKCVETGQVFRSIRECCEQLGISHKSLWNALNSKRPRNGLHFVEIKKEIKI